MGNIHRGDLQPPAFRYGDWVFNFRENNSDMVNGIRIGTNPLETTWTVLGVNNYGEGGVASSFS